MNIWPEMCLFLVFILWSKSQLLFVGILCQTQPEIWDLYQMNNTSWTFDIHCTNECHWHHLFIKKFCICIFCACISFLKCITVIVKTFLRTYINTSNSKYDIIISYIIRYLMTITRMIHTHVTFILKLTCFRACI